MGGLPAGTGRALWAAGELLDDGAGAAADPSPGRSGTSPTSSSSGARARAPAAYAKLLAVSAGAIRGADPGARIVTAGVAPVGAGYLPWTFLSRLYAVPGVKASFDEVAVHPYSARLDNTRAQIELERQIMVAAGDARTPLLISELGVASQGEVPSAFVQGEAGQAAFLRQAFAMLVANRRRWHLAGVDWFTWRDQPGADQHCAFCQGAGLFDVAGRPKLAWGAYRAAVRGAG